MVDTRLDKFVIGRIVQDYKGRTGFERSLTKSGEVTGDVGRSDCA